MGQLGGRVFGGYFGWGSTPEFIDDQIERFLVESVPVGGQVPSERAIAEKYGVSRYTVREALRRLAHRGLLTTRPGARARLNSPAEAATIAGQFLRRTRENVGELYEARIVIEGGAAALLASRVREGGVVSGQLERLREILDELDRFVTLPGAANARSSLDLSFHFELVGTVGNHMITAFEYSLLEPLREYPSLWAVDAVVASWQSEHRAILKHVMAGDPGLARHYVDRHLRAGHERLNKFLDESNKRSRPGGAPAKRSTRSSTANNKERGKQ